MLRCSTLPVLFLGKSGYVSSLSFMLLTPESSLFVFMIPILLNERWVQIMELLITHIFRLLVTSTVWTENSPQYHFLKYPDSVLF